MLPSIQTGPRYLDPRTAAEAAVQPFPDAVNIPMDELPDRMHELPPRHRTILIAADATNPTAANAVREWLLRADRRAEIALLDRTALSRAPGRAGIPRSLSPENPPVAAARLWEPTAYLAESAARLAPGRALDIACGTGRDAVFLASLGWRVTAVDRLPDAVALARDLERRYVGSGAPIDWRVEDVQRGGWAPGYRVAGGGDEAKRAGPAFDLITMFRFLDRPLIERLREWAASGATLLIETFTVRHRERHARPSREAHLLEPGELRARVEESGGWSILEYSEGWRAADDGGDGPHTARVCAARR